MKHVTLVAINGTTILMPYIDDLVQDWSNIALAMELLQSCTKPLVLSLLSQCNSLEDQLPADEIYFVHALQMCCNILTIMIECQLNSLRPSDTYDIYVSELKPHWFR